MKNKTILGILLILILTSCSRNTTPKEEKADKGTLLQQITESRGIDTEHPNTAISPELRTFYGLSKEYDAIREQYPDKTILTLLGISPADYITDAINEYLVQNKTEYVVYFHKPEISLDLFILTAKELKDFLSNETTPDIDIVYLGLNSFMPFAQEGLLEPIEYKLQEEKGKVLWNSLPENNWRSLTVDGHIYGVSGYSYTVFGPPTYIVNRKIMEQFGLKEEDLKKPLYELTELLAGIAKEEKISEGFQLVTIDSSLNNFQSSGYTMTPYSDATLLSPDISEDALVQLDDPEYLRWLSAVNELAKSGVIKSSATYNNIKDFFLHVRFFSGLPLENPNFGTYYDEEGELADKEDVVELVLEDNYSGSVRNQDMGNSILSSSANKEYAFDFLSRAYSDETLTNLLLYGVEDINYYLDDEKVTGQIRHNNDLFIGNTYLSLPMHYEFVNKKQLYLQLQNKLVNQYFGFEIDFSGVQEELDACNKIMKQLSGILDGGVADFDGFIRDLRNQLDESGIERVLEEINRQKAEWLPSLPIPN
ncbi:MAG TPA: DUF3502 domain-containing protein [Mobilitalea sp.]|nr:DUF3502 domain-containing protein [Mobilitalea sp.]